MKMFFSNFAESQKRHSAKVIGCRVPSIMHSALTERCRVSYTSHSATSNCNGRGNWYRSG